MARSIVLGISNLINKLDNAVSQAFRSPFRPEHLAIVETNSSFLCQTQNKLKFNLKDLIGDGILWAVPKHRRTVERRLSRKFGNPEFVWKPLKLKTYLRSCRTCGHDHEIGVLCPHCYAKVFTETKLMQNKIQEELGLNPVEEEVVLLYEGEKNEQSAEFLNGKRIVEMEKARPIWFSKNLVQKSTSTQNPAFTKEVKPSDLG